jgi:hypothetical protein
VIGKWEEGAPMVKNRSCFGLCELGGMFYASGGNNGEGVLLVSLECYDPTLDIWSAGPALPRGRSHHYACAVANTMYVLGGAEFVGAEVGILETRSVLKFDIGTEAWSEVAPMPQALHSFGACVLGNDIYVVGGIENDRTWTAAMHRYSTTANVWTTLAPMPDVKVSHSACVVSGLIYVIGGEVTPKKIDRSVHRFDPVENVWSTMAPTSTSRGFSASFLFERSIYVAGGFNGVDDLSSVERYDVDLDRWEVVTGMALRGPLVDFRAQVMRLEVNLFDSLETQARRARI